MYINMCLNVLYNQACLFILYTYACISSKHTRDVCVCVCEV